MIGDEPDLLIWTPKPQARQEDTAPGDGAAGSDGPLGTRRGYRTGAIRPLQLPTCRKRVLGAYWASRVGPAVEAQLSRHQAARQGSDCGCNIDRVFRHLDPLGDGGEAGDIEEQLWSDVLGPAAPGVAELCDGVGDCGLDGVPAVTLADQEKAFERMGLEWRRRVMMAWRIPRWATSVGDAMVHHNRTHVVSMGCRAARTRNRALSCEYHR